MTTLAVSTTETNLQKFALALQQLASGRSNANGKVTLKPNAATTKVPAVNCGADSAVFLMPTTANAAAEFKKGTLYVSAVENGSFTVTHDDNAETDRTFFFVCLG